VSFIPPTPPPPPYDAPSPPPLPGPRRAPVDAGTVIAWAVILLCVGAIASRPYWTPYVKRAPTSTEVAQQAVGEVRSPQLQMVGRYAIGAKAFTPAGQPETVDKLVAAVESAVGDNPVDELRAIPVIAELKGAEAALARLDEFERKHRVDRLRPDVEALRTIYTRGVAHLSESAARELVARHGWFGELAVSYGLPSHDSRREAAMAPAGRALVAAAAMTLGGLVALVAGIVLGILALVLYFKGQLPRAYRPADPATAGPFAEAFALYLLTFIGLSLAIGLLFPGAGNWASWAVTVVLPLAFAWLRLRGVPWPEVRWGLGWHAGRGLLREAGAGVVGYVTGLPVIALGLLVTLLLTNMTGEQPSHPIRDMPTDTAAAKLQILLLAAVWAPVIEETMFRGALFHHLRARLGWWASTLVVSLIFAVIHPQGWMLVPALGCVAVVLAGIREWRGSIVGPVVAHALHNGVLVVMFLTTAS
jgi:membrane protease YdiL (CAAX protease family)